MLRIVITGGPATGKTTLINALHDKGYAIIPEAARIVINQQLKLKSEALPWRDVSAFSKLVLKTQVNDYYEAGADIVFLDRGIPDVMAYMEHGEQVFFEGLEEHANNLQYDFVFFLPPWEEIFENDEARKETFEEALKISAALNRNYKKLNYQLIEVPKKTVEERIKYIESIINV